MAGARAVAGRGRRGAALARWAARALAVAALAAGLAWTQAAAQKPAVSAVEARPEPARGASEADAANASAANTAPSDTPTAAAPPPSGNATDPDKNAAAAPKSAPLRIGVATWGNLPFQDYRDGRARGFSIELLEQILGERGLSARYVGIGDSEAMVRALCEGRIDLAMNLRVSAARSRCMAYTDPIENLSLYALKRRDDARLLSEDALKRMRMAIPAALLEHTRDRNRFPPTQVVAVADAPAAVRAVAQGRADVYFDAAYVLDWYLREDPHPALELLPTSQLPPSMQRNDLGVLYAAPLTRLPLLKWLDAQIKRDPRRVEALRRKWLRADLQAPAASRELSAAQREWLARLPRLRLALADDAAPLSTLDSDGQPAGIAADYARLVEDRLGLDFGYVTDSGLRGAILALTGHRAELAVVPLGSLPGGHWVYSRPFERTPLVIASRARSAAAVGLESLAGKRVSVTLLSVAGRAVQRAAPNARVVAVSGDAEGLELLSAGQVDAHVGALAVLDRLRQTGYRPDALALAPTGLELELAFAADRRLAPLVDMIDQQLDALSEAERQRIHDHWVATRYSYGLPWNRVLAIVAVALLAINLIAAFYLRLRRESQRREAADSKLREVAGNLPGVVFKARRAANGQIRFPYLTGRAELLFGLDAERVVADSRVLFARVHGQDLPGLRKAIAAAARTMSGLHADFRMRGEDGQWRWVRVSALPRPQQPGEDRADAGYTGYFVDVTDVHLQAQALARAKEQAEAATRAKSRFLATMSHEIRTPMGGMIGMLELLERSPLDPDQQALLGHLRDSSQALQGLLDDILDVSRIEEGRMRIELAPLQPRRLADAAALHALAACRNQGLRLDLRVDAAVPEAVLGDALRLRQVLLNLLGNAVKFTHSGRVWLDLRVRGQRLEIEIGDTGIGMGPTQLRRAFEPFRQGADDTPQRFGGTGLGLWICRQLVELMGGRMRLDSREGQGTRACLELPLRAAVAGADAPPVAPLRVAVALADARRADTLRHYLRALQHTLVEPGEVADLSFEDGARAGSIEVRRADADPAPRYELQADPVLFAQVRRACDWARDPAAAGSGEPARAAAAPAPGPARILVAEDGPVNRELIRRQLLELGHASRVCGDGREALAALDGGGYGLLLSDCRMPELDGYALARAIRAEEARRGGARLAIVAITASALPEQIERCRAAGMDDWLIKPVRLQDLQRVLQRWLADAAAPAAPTQASVTGELGALGAALPLLLRELPREREDIAAALRAQDRAALAHALHRCAGAIALFDAALAQRAQALEAAIAQQPLRDCAAAVGELLDELEGMQRRWQALARRA
ncbi:ATP-binding protein [Lysobacter enzymogenes]|uniref:ATP-binding protein n=1 Tax=Lysobacter enzymogenes TaxID=69 RepID=UPI00089AC515|nr:transporter substrate-binding domain-containing protein [Lysobacter enzymogenes]SDX64738.1 two-component system, NarL family, sensor histidine kinase EvgS [Lysobacter enzymogenes]